ncbi:hypothetical protein Chor_008208, partial [Crotalus horridus]
TLSTSDNVEDREHEKARLEEAYEKCDHNLDELIVQHYNELMTAISTYQSITERMHKTDMVMSFPGLVGKLISEKLIEAVAYLESVLTDQICAFRLQLPQRE